jgi:glutamine amidotransferase
MIHPIIDDFYSANPAHTRSAGYAQAKGQTITGPDKVVLQERVNGLEGGTGSPDSRSKETVREVINRLTVA